MWFGGVELDDKIYAIPQRGGRLHDRKAYTLKVLVYHTDSGKVTASEAIPKDVFEGGDGDRQYQGGIALKGKIYGFPDHADKPVTTATSTSFF